ncbi:MAG: serine/threonine protein kinase, bacterial [Blastocatellia bacterium]|jgi:serine/threonine-protein kinase|nr:serine/threonine protein kinase, bacterial [Blastocatellia bacterium]
MSFCHECGVKVAPDDPYCGNCGAALHDNSARDEAAPAVATDESDAASKAAPAAHEAASTAAELDDTETPDAPDMDDTETPDSPFENESASRKDEVVSIKDDTGSREARIVEAPSSSTPSSSSTPVAEVPSSPTPAAANAPQMNVTLPPGGNNMADDMRDTDGAKPSSAAKVVPPTARAGSTGGRQPTSKQLETATMLNGRYEIVRRIGGGGMGAVYLAKDHHLGDAPRAVKEMVESHIDDAQHEKAIGDFKRESLLLTSLEHSSIPTIYDYFYDDAAGRFYLVMKYISGGDFAARLRNAPGGRIDEKTVADWGVQIADVLDYLHKRPKPIIYRDLKPANLMIDGNSGRVMLIDFGIARWVTPQEKGVTAVGTMGYAPPELFSGKVEPRSDIYSLGATMFHLLTGSDPQDNPLLIFDFTKNPRPRQINPAISNEMERILMRAVEYKPEGRFRSAGEMREALAAHLERLRAGEVSYGATSAQNLGGETIQTEMVFCGFCGGRIAADDVFCAHCGAKQPLVGVGSSAALRTARATARLIVAGTTELDVSFHLQKEDNLVGRSDPHSNIFPEVDLSKFDPETKVSRRHARIWRKGDQFLIEDLSSVNGTVINDAIRLAPRQPRVLESGDKLRLGETTLHFLVG